MRRSLAALPALVALALPLGVVGTASADTVTRAPRLDFAADGFVTGVAVEPATGDFWVSEPGGVHRYSPSGVSLGPAIAVSGTPGRGAFDPEGRYVVPVDGSTDRILRLVPSGIDSEVTSPLTLNRPVAVAVGADDTIYVANQDGDSAYGFKGGAVVANLSGPTSQIDSPTGIAVGRTGLIYVGDLDGTVHVFDPTTSAAPVRTVSAAGTGFRFTECYEVALDSAQNLYLVGVVGDVAVFAPSQRGSVAPKRSLHPDTTQAPAIGLFVDARRRLVIGHGDGVQVFDALVPFARPAPVRGLAVGGARTAGRRPVTWRKVATPLGEKPVTSYAVVVRKGSKVLVRRTVTTGRLVLRRGQLKAGRLTVSVRAHNSVGDGPVTTRSFKVVMPAQHRS